MTEYHRSIKDIIESLNNINDPRGAFVGSLKDIMGETNPNDLDKSDPRAGHIANIFRDRYEKLVETRNNMEQLLKRYAEIPNKDYGEIVGSIPNKELSECSTYELFTSFDVETDTLVSTNGSNLSPNGMISVGIVIFAVIQRGPLNFVPEYKLLFAHEWAMGDSVMDNPKNPFWGKPEMIEQYNRIVRGKLPNNVVAEQIINVFQKLKDMGWIDKSHSANFSAWPLAYDLHMFNQFFEHMGIESPAGFGGFANTTCYGQVSKGILSQLSDNYELRKLKPRLMELIMNRSSVLHCGLSDSIDQFLVYQLLLTFNEVIKYITMLQGEKPENSSQNNIIKKNIIGRFLFLY